MKDATQAIGRASFGGDDPFGWYFVDDPAKFCPPGSGFRLGVSPPQHCSNSIPLFIRPQPERGWQYMAAEWLEEQAQQQEKTNAEYTRHAESYKEWRDRPLILRMLAERVKKAEGTIKPHCPTPAWMFPDELHGEKP